MEKRNIVLLMATGTLGIALLLFVYIPSIGGDTTSTVATPEAGSIVSNVGSVYASANEIGSMFVCPCCGSPITKKCCGASRERMTYIEALVDAGLTKDQVVMNAIRKYGLTALFESEREKVREILKKNAPEDRPAISIEPSKYDFGDVSVAGGEVSTYFSVKNTGTEDLVIDNIETSCGCTSAALVVDGVEGPRFSMVGHGKRPEEWSATIPPGGEAQLKVYYDPAVHKNMKGAVTRTIDVSSNDPIDSKKQIKIELKQVA